MEMPVRPGHNLPTMTGGKLFLPRLPELRQLEGWYNTGLYRFKVSCKFNDILRCARTTHFLSCFRSQGECKSVRYAADYAGVHEIQPLLRCLDPTWAIIYTPDRRGDFLGRCFLRFLPVGTVVQEGFVRTIVREPRYEVGRVYGNALNYKDIMNIINFNGLECRTDLPDTYL